MNLVKREKLVKIHGNLLKSIERHPVKILGRDFRVKIIYKNVKIAQLDVEEDIIKITLQNKYKKIDNQQMLDLAIDKMYESLAKEEIERAMEKTRIMLGFAPEEYEIKKMKTLGKCENNKIIIHPEIVMYNRKIIDYVILHQYCHLKSKTHSKKFFELIKRYEKDYEKYEKEISKYVIKSNK